MTTSFAKTIDHLLGRRHFQLTVSGVPATSETGSYTNARQLITEIANARVWGGVHFRFSTTVGTRIGIQVADYDNEHALQPNQDRD